MIKMSKELQGVIAEDAFLYKEEKKVENFSPLFLLFEFSDGLDGTITGALDQFDEEVGEAITIRGIFRVLDIHLLIARRNFIKKVSIVSESEKIQTTKLVSHRVEKYGVCKDENSEDLYVFYIVLTTP